MLARRPLGLGSWVLFDFGGLRFSRDETADGAILRILLDHEPKAPLSVHELGLEIGDRVELVDSLARLQAVGLIHRCGEFVFSTAAARRFTELM